MLRCKHVAEALADKRYWELPLHRRIGLHLHVFLCFLCGRYNRQIMALQDAARHYAAYELAEVPPSEYRLSPEARERIRRKLREET